MSHSSIIELSKTKLGIDERITEDYFYSGFQGWVADYVDDDLSEDAREDVIACFIGNLISEFPDLVTTDGISITFKEGFREAFSRKRIAQIKDLVEKADDADLFDLTHKLNHFIGDPTGDYIYEAGTGTWKMAQFLRGVEPGEYFFGGVIDYKA